MSSYEGRSLLRNMREEKSEGNASYSISGWTPSSHELEEECLRATLKRRKIVMKIRNSHHSMWT